VDRKKKPKRSFEKKFSSGQGLKTSSRTWNMEHRSARSSSAHSRERPCADAKEPSGGELGQKGWLTWCAKRVPVRRPSRSRPQRLGSRGWQWIGSGGAHQRLPTRRRSSERERDSRTRGRSATRAWPFPRRGGGHRRRMANGKCVALQMDGCVALQMDGCASSCAWVASPVRSQQRAWVLRTAPIAAGAHPIAAAAAAHLRWACERAAAARLFPRRPLFTPRRHNCEAVRVSVGTYCRTSRTR
jgi:hypothetical protein